jgi:hypothetical protein|tara:strand:+ start:90 stop:635 length:546 start_codon:yes stop_codon:yes gene_type:complete
MKKFISLIASILTLTLYSISSFAAGDEENIKKLSSFKNTGTQAGVIIPQDTRYAANIKKNILPHIKMPPGFKIELFAVAPDARNMAVSRNKGTVWIGTRKTKVWQATGAGNSVIIPNITAQQKNYLVARLKSYKSGEVKHPQMTVVAQMLSEQDINDVSEWYSRIKITIFNPEVEIAKPKL